MLTSNECFGVVQITQVAWVVSARFLSMGDLVTSFCGRNLAPRLTSTGLATVSTISDNTSYTLAAFYRPHNETKCGPALCARPFKGLSLSLRNCSRLIRPHSASLARTFSTRLRFTSKSLCPTRAPARTCTTPASWSIKHSKSSMKPNNFDLKVAAR